MVLCTPASRGGAADFLVASFVKGRNQSECDFCHNSSFLCEALTSKGKHVVKLAEAYTILALVCIPATIQQSKA